MDLQRGSDLEIVIQSAHLLDNHLTTLLQVTLYGDAETRKDLLGNSGRLRAIAYCVGLINTQDFHDLQMIYGIRNRFAHPKSLKLPTFATDQIMAYIGNLSAFREGREAGLDGRAIFIKHVYRLAGRLNRKLGRVKQLKSRSLEVFNG